MRGLLLRVGLCCLGCCAVASAGAEQLSPEVLEKRVAVAQELAASGNVDQALAELEEIVETTRHPGIRMLTAKVSFENQRWQRSRHHFTVLANGAMGNSAEVWFSLGVIAERVDGAVETALSHYRKAVEYSPVHAEALSSLGTLLAKTHSGDQAKVAAGMALLTRAMDASPKDPVILRNHRLVRRQVPPLPSLHCITVCLCAMQYVGPLSSANMISRSDGSQSGSPKADWRSHGSLTCVCCILGGHIRIRSTLS